jgi:hypothetical protein
MTTSELPASCDRRILKAFYTQYVAVLLILLVFTVAAFQRAQAVGDFERPPERRMEEPSPFGLISLIGEDRDVSQRALLEGQLEAVATILREHDVRAVVNVPLQREGDDDKFREAIDRLSLIEDLLREKEISAESLRLRIISASPGSRVTTVDFEEVRDDKQPL